MKHTLSVKDAVFTLITLVLVFILNIAMQDFFDTKTLIPMIFVLGVFLISLKTQGYFWGITASLISVLAVNYAFTYPYYAIDLISPECLASAAVMLLVAIMTGTLTTQIKHQQKIKAETELEHMRGNLLRAVSHDLRTPLTTIYGSCSAIVENYDSLSKEQQLQFLSEIQKDSEWLIRMVENLLSVTRIDAENVQVTKLPTVLEELVDAVLIKFRKRCPEQNVQVEIPEDFISIPMDAMLIEQVLINILENAVDHAIGMTKLTLRVSLENNSAVFCITDNGCGISTDRMTHLFSGLPQQNNIPADGTRSNMGIGLSVCNAIIKAHGSELRVCNNKAGGASFSFALKLENE